MTALVTSFSKSASPSLLHSAASAEEAAVFSRVAVNPFCREKLSCFSWFPTSCAFPNWLGQLWTAKHNCPQTLCLPLLLPCSHPSGREGLPSPLNLWLTGDRFVLYLHHHPPVVVQPVFSDGSWLSCPCPSLLQFPTLWYLLCYAWGRDCLKWFWCQMINQSLWKSSATSLHLLPSSWLAVLSNKQEPWLPESAAVLAARLFLLGTMALDSSTTAHPPPSFSLPLSAAPLQLWLCFSIDLGWSSNPACQRSKSKWDQLWDGPNLLSSFCTVRLPSLCQVLQPWALCCQLRVALAPQPISWCVLCQPRDSPTLALPECAGKHCHSQHKADLCS